MNEKNEYDDPAYRELLRIYVKDRRVNEWRNYVLAVLLSGCIILLIGLQIIAFVQ